jgi:hypothetical protein
VVHEWKDAEVPSDRTTVTELGTGLGMLGLASIEEALRSRAPAMHSVSPEMWEHLERLRAGGAYDAEFHAAWANGREFLRADEGLRGRLPRVIEWKGTGRAPGDEVAPIDLRVDHVYLVSCKYLSKILFNVSPNSIFDSLLFGGPGRAARTTREVSPGGGDWFADVAPVEYQTLYETVRAAAQQAAAMAPSSPDLPSTPAPLRRPERPGPQPALVALPGLGAVAENGTPNAEGTEPSKVPPELHTLPLRAVDLTVHQREALRHWLRPGWPPSAKERYVALSGAVARASARRWEAAMDERGGTGEAMVWRLLRIGSAPYFVLGSSADRSLRFRIATSWDWRQHFQLIAISMEGQAGGQPRVGWEAVVRDRSSSETRSVVGHIEVRWSHGRFGGLPEAKGYLDTPHHLVPGYFTLR